MCSVVLVLTHRVLYYYCIISVTHRALCALLYYYCIIRLYTIRIDQSDCTIRGAFALGNYVVSKGFYRHIETS